MKDGFWPDLYTLLGLVFSSLPRSKSVNTLRASWLERNADQREGRLP